LRGVVSVAIPAAITAGQLRALASLLASVERAPWESLAATFDKMDRDAAQLAEPLESMLGQLADQLRVEAQQREPTPSEAVRGA
jgi:hypothetical protein